MSGANIYGGTGAGGGTNQSGAGEQWINPSAQNCTFMGELEEEDKCNSNRRNGVSAFLLGVKLTSACASISESFNVMAMTAYEPAQHFIE
ncbi:hypothetical protein AVEN_62368-1 [Araneus ventricosus]|uniref:Uncharacterized protein n=1 Tax=Araneus ventricosus TaxID=182803 RepID=A0A4Y2H400_ARAVE|nr:hypothetical protein AVEN_62368-1 [Araneus ventricosus]